MNIHKNSEGKGGEGFPIRKKSLHIFLSIAQEASFDCETVSKRANVNFFGNIRNEKL